MKNIFENIGQAGEEELFDVIQKGTNYRIERIVSAGHSSPEGFFYDQENDEWIMLVQGEATLEMEGKYVEMKAGDYMFVPKNCKHRIEKTSIAPTCIWLCIFVMD